MIPSYVSGGIVDLENFSAKDFDLRTAVTCLSRINRFSGHTAYPYSVAQHSVVVSYLVPEWAAAPALLHDLAEAYVGDCPGPVKKHLPVFVDLENRISDVIYKAIGVENPKDTRRVVENADKWALRLEQINLQGRSEFFDFEPKFTAIPEARLDAALSILGEDMSPTLAYRTFMIRYWELLVAR